MLRNYLAVAFRSLVSNRLHSLINIGGLAVGLAACLLILLFVHDELSYDAWMANADRTISVETRFNVPGRETIAVAGTPGPAKQAFEKDFSSDIERAVRVWGNRMPIRIGDRKFREEIVYADPGVFDVFDLTMIAGKREDALANNVSIILSETMARKFFGELPAVGNTIIVGEKTVYTVVGVFADIPKGSHTTMGAVALFDPERYKEQPWIAERWTSANTRVYLLLRTPEALDRLVADMPAFIDRNVRIEVPGFTEKPSTLMNFDLMPVRDIHLHSDKQGYENLGSLAAVVAFAGIALLILVIACINFVNLATARAMTRAREVALRKVVGATRRELVIQHLGEAILVALVALVFAIAIVELALGPFNSFLNKDLELNLLGDPGLALAMLGLIVAVGVIGGLYPAFYLSRFRPASVLKANQSSASGSSRLRTGLVIFQFAISIGLIICTTVIYAQTRYARTFDLGFAKDDRLVISALDDITPEARETLKREVGAVAGVKGVALSSDTPPLNNNNNTLFYPTATVNSDRYLVEQLRVDPDFFSLYGVEPLAGRLFSRDRAGDFAVTDDDKRPDPKQSVVINRSFVDKLGAKEPAEVIGRVLYQVNDEGKPLIPTTIVGVIPDLYFRSVRAVITPTAYYVTTHHQLYALTVHYDHDRQPEVTAAIETIWNRVVPAVPIQIGYIDDQLAKQYDTDAQRGQIFGGFAVFAILIACLGLFGLASFSAQRRTKEIGMRKVLGASVLDIVRLLVWQFSRPVLIASLIAWPVSFYVMRRWLGGFEYSISITDPRVLMIFVAATLIAVAIAWLTTAGHAVRVARANPARALRTE
jgi:putative ABC transport system permease protein